MESVRRLTRFLSNRSKEMAATEEEEEADSDILSAEEEDDEECVLDPKFPPEPMRLKERGATGTGSYKNRSQPLPQQYNFKAGHRKEGQHQHQKQFRLNSSRQHSHQSPSFLLDKSQQRRRNSDGRTHRKTSRRKIPVMVITDIGADIDDTLALLVLLGASDIFQLVCVVTSVNDGIMRGALTRGWLRTLGVPDETVEILPSVDGLPAACHVPDDFPSPDHARLGKVEDTPKNIVKICKRYKRNELLVIGIASLTPLALALQLDAPTLRRAIGKLYLQGNVYIHSKKKGDNNGQIYKTTSPPHISDDSVYIAPNPLAYNFRNDMEAAEIVFEQLQNHVPFVFLGKFAAYRIGITKEDFDYLNKQYNPEPRDKNNSAINMQRPDLVNMARTQMNNFRKGNPELFNRIYEIDGKYQDDLESTAWFVEMPKNGVCSHPYDPLLMMCLIEDHRSMAGGRKGGEELTSSDPTFNFSSDGAAEEKWFSRNYCFVENRSKSKHAPSRIMHTIVGNNEKDHGIIKVTDLHNELVNHIAAGLRRG